MSPHIYSSPASSHCVLYCLHRNDTCYNYTFQAACTALGLLDNDKEWETCFTESIVFSTGHILRQLFVSILTCADVLDPAALWSRFGKGICSDLPRKMQRLQSPSDLEDAPLCYGLHLISQLLMDVRRSLTDFHSLQVTFLLAAGYCAIGGLYSTTSLEGIHFSRDVAERRFVLC